MPTLTVQDLTVMVDSIFRSSGVDPAQSAAMARVIVAAERDACKSHGIYRIAGCLRTISAGKVIPDAKPCVVDDGTPVVRVNAQGGFSCAAFELGVPVLAARARDQGLAALIINNCTHFTALWPEVEVLADAGLAGIAMCPSYATVAPSGGTAALLGTNPFAFGWPRPNQLPYVFDFATSVAARGEIELHQRAGTPLPEGWAINESGEPTTDPTEALAGAMLPFGGHKGSAISTMIELLAGVMIGDRTSPDVKSYLGGTTLLPQHGELILAFDPQQFSRGSTADPLEKAELLFGAIVGQGARLPSTRRYAARLRSELEGIMLTQKELLDMLALKAAAARQTNRG